MKDSEIKRLSGGWSQERSCLGREIFSEEVLDFLLEFTREIGQDSYLKSWPAAASFAFWCRKNRLRQWQANISDFWRKGHGMVFHVAPSNIPLLFAYSMVYGMLAGNGNLIRISEKIVDEARPFLDLLDKVMRAYPNLYQENMVFTYGHDRQLNDYFSGICQARVLWGGDETIYSFRKSMVSPGCIQLEFFDRYSVALFEADYILSLNEADRLSLAEAFYNDTYEVDQNACSSPQIIFWVKGANCSRAKRLWWQSVYQIASKKYQMDFMRANEKYALLCSMEMDFQEIQNVEVIGKELYLVSLAVCDKNVEKYQGKYGIFYQTELEEKEMLLPYLNRRVQTVIYGGSSPLEHIRKMILEGKALGGDRVAAIGDALNLQESWDGKDMIRTLSRVIG